MSTDVASPAKPETVPLLPPRAKRNAAVGIGLIAVAAGWTSILTIASTQIVAGNSDGATVVLEGQAMSTGNLALGGWSLSLDSFWSIDAAFYALVARVIGLGPVLLHIVPALLTSLVVLIAVLAAVDCRIDRKAIVPAIVVIAVLGLPSPDLSYYLLQGPWHVGTALWCLLAFLAFARHRYDRWWALGVLLCATGLLGDFLILPLGLVPTILAGLLSSIRARRLAAGAPQLLGAIASLPLALLIRLICNLAGTFTLVNRNVVVRGPQVVTNFGHLGHFISAMFGTGQIAIDHLTNGAVGFQAAHAVVIVLIAISILVALWRSVSSLIRPGSSVLGVPASTLEDLLLLAILADVATFAWGAGSDNTDYVKYLTPGLVFAVVLGARLVACVIARLVKAPLRLLAAGACLALLTVFAIELGIEMEKPNAPQPAAALGQFLRAHHLTNGVGDYWSSSIVTVESSGSVLVRPITPGPPNATGPLARYERQSATDWYRGQHFQFFVYDTARPWHRVNAMSAASSFGTPAHTYAVGTYRVLVWAHPITVSLSVPSATSPLRFFWR